MSRFMASAFHNDQRFAVVSRPEAGFRNPASVMSGSRVIESVRALLPGRPASQEA
ncbi:hypothetical protein AOE01nite_12950 [Acetobacter oeni]|uniref:Uncharacterized protein n=1 Tax=Acetobacter oeni TaxID=304077 RepID=A0A511XJH4_9PROT|nr:hypothetical protein [Acetobacter oeni]GBR04873.1 hypothetical protein AA21952_1556 [Acetobacter oeni LMG 21952]GEN63071.1 hypothetical protein AOE01nite_12950 [Acetobacter oeni]